MHVIFAAMLLAQIHTGADLLTACKADDTTACDALIRDVIEHNDGAACFAHDDPASVRRELVFMIEQYKAVDMAGVLDKPAGELARDELISACANSN